MGAGNKIRGAIPRETRDRIALGRVQLRRLLPKQKLPDFLVIGAQKAGTSSLFKYLAEHPDVARPVQKEIAFFSLNYGRGLGWYRAHFPSRRSDRMAFEATPHYLFCPEVPPRVVAQLPEVKAIAVLRDPIDRAVSQYWHMRRRAFESREMQDALLAPESLASPAHCDPPVLRHSYVARGYYAEQLRRWLEFVPRERLLVIRSDDLFGRTAETYASVLRFLGLPPFELSAYPNYTPGKNKLTGAGDALVDRLKEVYAPHAADLQSLLGSEWSWW